MPVTCTQTGSRVATWPILNPIFSSTVTEQLMPGNTYEMYASAWFNSDTTGFTPLSGGQLFALASRSMQATPDLRVTTNTDVVDPNDGVVSLREAIGFAAANPGAATITFAAGLDGQTITLGSEIVLDSDVTLDASSLPSGITVSGSNAHRIFVGNADSTVTLRRLKLTGGNGAGANSSGYGGAIFSQGTLTLEDCTLAGNTAANSGAAACAHSGSLTLARCTLSGNTGAAWGGAIRSDSATVALTQCTLSGNQAANQGGALYASEDSVITLAHCTLAGNSAPVGGAIFRSAQPLGELPPGLVSLRTTIAADNFKEPGHTTADDIYGLVNAKFSLIGVTNGTSFATNSANNLTGVSANLAPLTTNGGPTRTHALRSGSPAYNAGDSAFTTSAGTVGRVRPRPSAVPCRGER